jgi:hypothetical protein
VESPTPVTGGRRGGRGAGARRRAASRGVCAHRRGAVDRRRGGASRTLEEEEAGLLQFEGGGILPRRPDFEGLELSLVFPFAGWCQPSPSSRLLRRSG